MELRLLQRGGERDRDRVIGETQSLAHRGDRGSVRGLRDVDGVLRRAGTTWHADGVALFLPRTDQIAIAPAPSVPTAISTNAPTTIR